MNQFWGVSFVGRENIVSVITETYGFKLQHSAPEFYQHFRYQTFHSSKSLTELNAELPFKLFKREESFQTIAISSEQLLLAEAEHLAAHREILLAYRRFQLEPLPPWEHTLNGDALVVVSDLMNRLKKATDLFLTTKL